MFGGADVRRPSSTALRSLSDRVRRRMGVGAVRDDVGTTEWHLPPGPGPSLAVTEVADLALLQGMRPPSCSPDEAMIELDGGAEPQVRSISSWFAPPGAREREPVAFAVTLDEADLAGSTRCRLRCADEGGAWHELPSLRTPRGMPGVEVVAECPACESRQRSVVGRRQGLTMQRCQGCGLVMTSPRPAEDNTLVRYSRPKFPANLPEIKRFSSKETPL